MTTSNKSKKNLILILGIVFVCMLVLCIRVGWIQIVRGDELSERAIQQQTRDTPIEAERGVIYDTNGNELAVSVTCYTIWARPSDIKAAETAKERSENIEEVSTTLSELLEMDYADVKKMVTLEQSIVKVKKGIDKETADKIREKGLQGIEIAEDTMRSYPLGAFAAHTLGSVTDDNVGLSGLELEYNTYLSGVAGRWINYTDTRGYRLSYGEEKYYKAEDGYSVVTTIDQVIQHYTEKALAQVQEKTSSKRVLAIVMDTETGDILAMGQTPEFDLNDPKTPLDKEEQKALEGMSEVEQVNYWNKMWRNSLICDVYEPGSTFKLITTAIALEENMTKMDDSFTCTGSIEVAGERLHCWRSSNPHGTLNLKQAVANSCNPVFVELAGRIGIDLFYSHLDTLGITGTTGIDFPGEGTAILQSRDTAGPVGLATIGFGQGVAVTPIQLITAISSFGNDGKLMKPRLVKELRDENGNTVQEFEPDIVRQAISKETADEMREIMEFSGESTIGIEGYKVGAKTGTANKIKEDGTGYSNDTYSSCIAMAPMDDPKVSVLVIVDSPQGVHFGSATAAPGVKQILEDTLRYLNISPDAENQEEEEQKKVAVPDVVGTSVSEAIGVLAGASLSYDLDEAAAEKDDFIVTKQYPAAGTKIKKGSKVYLYN
ncbi:MAG: penicillin-binding transpeptidase domain-containing protein [Anaerovoracaceae bacterium]|nr:penicillin-binding transpeptidase domain-containing protein [Anaerovoracaceae bacterium]